MDAKTIILQLQTIANREIAAHSQRFFKTAPGEYGEGDQFWGIRVNELRKRVKHCVSLSRDDLLDLIYHPVHEVRLMGWLILVKQFESHRQQTQRQEIVAFYLQHLEQANNWDLVDSSCHKILGPYLLNKDQSTLLQLAKSNNLWRQRAAVVSCFYFIKRGDYSMILELAQRFISHPHDLIHKAVGWMLREVGKQQLSELLNFLNQYAPQMPRTMLSYAIEKLDPEVRRCLRAGEKVEL